MLRKTNNGFNSKDVYLSSGFEYDDTEKEYTWAVYLDEEIDNDDSVIDFAVKE